MKKFWEKKKKDEVTETSEKKEDSVVSREINIPPKEEKKPEPAPEKPEGENDNSKPEEKPKRKMNRALKIVLIVAAVWAALAAAAVLLIDGRHVKFYVSGGPEITAEYGFEYEDPGVYAVSNGRLFGESSHRLKVDIQGAPDCSELGTFKVDYVVNYLFRSYKTQRTVTVADTLPPEIELIHKEGYEPDWFTGYKEEGYTAADMLDGDVTDKVECEVFPDKRVYTVTDSSGNTASVTRQSNFSDTAPVISLNGEEVMEVYASPYFADPGFTAADKLGNDYTELIHTEGEVIPYKPGSYELRYFITNAVGDTIEAKRTVNVLPTDLPASIDPEEMTIYLTFDDGPGPYTGQLLDVLAEYDVKATFFVTCLNSKYEDYIGRAFREGHAIGAHTASHNYYTVYASEDAFFQDLNQVEELIYNQTGQYSSLLRFPGGSSNTVSNFNPGIMSRLTAAVTDMGYKYFDWNVSSGDAGETTNTATVVENVISGCAGRKASVVLQHDIKDYSVAAVEDIIIWGLNNGYTFRALDMTSPTAHHGIAN